eukprot:2012003-Rhodomonas_salina.1
MSVLTYCMVLPGAGQCERLVRSGGGRGGGALSEVAVRYGRFASVSAVWVLSTRVCYRCLPRLFPIGVTTAVCYACLLWA